MQSKTLFLKNVCKTGVSEALEHRQAEERQTILETKYFLKFKDLNKDDIWSGDLIVMPE